MGDTPTDDLASVDAPIDTEQPPGAPADPLAGDQLVVDPLAQPAAVDQLVQPAVDQLAVDPLAQPLEPPVESLVESPAEPPAESLVESPAESLVESPAEPPTEPGVGLDAGLDAVYRDIVAALDRGDEAALDRGCRALVAHVVSMAESVRAAYRSCRSCLPAAEVEPADPEAAALAAENDALEAEIRAVESDIRHLELAIAATEAETARLIAA